MKYFFLIFCLFFSSLALAEKTTHGKGKTTVIIAGKEVHDHAEEQGDDEEESEEEDDDA